MTVPHPRRRGARREHDTRRLHDLLRSAVLGNRFGGGLPSESALMSDYAAPRSTVRQALAMLRADGLIDRLPGVGTHVLVAPPRTDMDEALGVTPGGEMYASTTPPRVLDRSTVETPGSLAGTLGVEPGDPVLRVEYVAMTDGLPAALATNYVVHPEADRVRATPFHGHWYQLLADAGVEIGRSEFVIDCLTCDPIAARLLELPQGAPLLSIEQTISDSRGRVVDLAFLRIRSDRFRFVSHATTAVLH